jgi:hypothetical protein
VCDVLSNIPIGVVEVQVELPPDEDSTHSVITSSADPVSIVIDSTDPSPCVNVTTFLSTEELT